MIQLRVKNFNLEELVTLQNALSTAIFSIPCDVNEFGFCANKECKNYKPCIALGEADAFLSKAIEAKRKEVI